jgi:hypothetical protein
VLRAAELIDNVPRHNPFLKAGVEQKELHVLLLADPPAPHRVQELDPDRSPPSVCADKKSICGSSREWRTQN